MIHKFSQNGYNIVLDVNSGAVHVLDEIAFDMLDLYKDKTKEEAIKIVSQKYSKEEAIAAYEEINELEVEELLYTEDTYSTSEYQG